VTVYHRTSNSNAAAIISDGFRDGVGNYGTTTERAGVWLSSTPLDANEGAHGDTLCSFDIPAHVLAPYEWVQDLGYREFLVPAEVVNSYATGLTFKAEQPEPDPEWFSKVKAYQDT
jgi:hypothetical protein